MAKQIVTTTEYIDDIDGGPAVGTVTFAYDGTDYEIDLSKANARALEKVMATYVQHGRKVRPSRARRSTTAASKRDLSMVRAWAHENGFEVSERGRIASAVLDAYDSASS